MKLRLLLSLLTISLQSLAQTIEVPQSFEALTPIVAKEWVAYIFVGAEFDTNVSQYSFNQGSYENEPVDPICFVTISPEQTEKILIGFSEGASDDPEFYFFSLNNGSFKQLFSLTGGSLYIPGNGNLYLSAAANNMYEKKTKYKFEDNNIREVKQPYYHVGLKTQTLKTITIYSDESCTTPLATLPKKSEIEVIAAKESEDELEFSFLIKSSFGLLGWWKLDSYYSQKIEYLYFHGD